MYSVHVRAQTDYYALQLLINGGSIQHNFLNHIGTYYLVIV